MPVFFQAAHGGLHNHVAAQVFAARKAGWTVTLMCKPGAFADAMSSACTIIHADFEDIDRDVVAALNNGPYELVHAHPWASREVGERVAQQLAIPIAVTHHNFKVDNLPENRDRIDMVVAVSDFARRFIIDQAGVAPERIVTIPNGVDRSVFRPASRRSHRPSVLVASRFDRDKWFMLELIKETFAMVAGDPARWRAVDWVIAGDGTELPHVRSAAQQIAEAVERDCVKMCGWLGKKKLAEAMNRSSVTVATGRTALEALACGANTVALGGRGYLGLLDDDTALRAVVQNFGGRELGWEDYISGSLMADIDRALNDGLSARRSRLGASIAAMHDQCLIDQQHVRLWELLISLRPRAEVQ